MTVSWSRTTITGQSAAASRSRPNSSAIVSTVQCAFSPLGLGSTHTRVSPIVLDCGPTRAFRSSNAAR